MKHTHCYRGHANIPENRTGGNCKLCGAIRRKKWREDFPERKMFTDNRRRARLAGIPFTIEQSDVVIPKKCPVFGILLAVAPGGYPLDNSPSLDKVVPAKG